MPSSRLYIGRISSRASERDLKKFFDGYGKITEVMMKNGYAFLDFDDYKDADDAVYDLNGKELCGERVILEHAKGIDRTMGGGGGGGDRDRDGGRGYGGGSSRDSYRERDSYSSGPAPRARNKYGPPVKTKWEVRVENLSSRVSWQDLKDHCRPYGEVTYADAHRKEKNVAVICFATEDDMKQVVRKMDGVELNGRKIEMLEQRESRSRSRSRSPRRSRSPPRKSSRSRSRSRSPPRRSRSGSRRRSPSRSKSKSPAGSKSRSPPAKSRSRSPSRSRSRSREN